MRHSSTSHPTDLLARVSPLRWVGVTLLVSLVVVSQMVLLFGSPSFWEIP